MGVSIGHASSLRAWRRVRSACRSVAPGSRRRPRGAGAFARESGRPTGVRAGLTAALSLSLAAPLPPAGVRPFGSPDRDRLPGPALAYRFAVVYRERPAPAARRFDTRPTGACRSRTRSSLPGGRAAGVVHPGPRRAGTGRRPRPRLGIGPRPDAAERPGPPRRRVPLPDLRRPRARRQPRRDAADQRRGVPRLTPLAALDALLARPEVTAGGFLGHSLGAVGSILAAAELGDAAPRS